MDKINKVFEPINQSVTIVVTNYFYINRSSFWNDLTKGNIINRYDVKAKEAHTDIPSEENTNISPPLPAELIEILPQEYTTKAGINFQLFPAPEFKLTVSTRDLNEAAFNNFSKITNDLLDRKFTDIEAFGLNFLAEFNLEKIKLQLLNKDVEKIDTFKKNRSFEFVLPLNKDEEDDSIATYRIRKLEGGDETNKDRIYEVNVNFHFNLQSLSTKEKIKKIDELNFNNYYKKFLSTSQEFLALNDRQTIS